MLALEPLGCRRRPHDPELACAVEDAIGDGGHGLGVDDELHGGVTRELDEIDERGQRKDGVDAQRDERIEAAGEPLRRAAERVCVGAHPPRGAEQDAAVLRERRDLVDRSQRATPSWLSRLAIAWLTADWTRRSFLAAAEKLPSSATAMNVRSCSSVMESCTRITMPRRAAVRSQGGWVRAPAKGRGPFALVMSLKAARRPGQARSVFQGVYPRAGPRRPREGRPLSSRSSPAPAAGRALSRARSSQLEAGRPARQSAGLAFFTHSTK